MVKKKYIKPEIRRESLEVDSEFALGCGSSVPAQILACMRMYAPNEYEELVYGWGMTDDTPIDSPIFGNIVFSNSKTCQASCYQGPYDSFFAS